MSEHTPGKGERPVNRDPRNPYAISDGEDYGHALAVLEKLQGASAEREAAVLESHDFRCSKCGATMRVTKDEWPKQTPCEHSYWHYRIELTPRGEQSR